MRKIIVITYLAVVMAGCNSMPELRVGKPEASYQSKRPVDLVADCILFGWQKQSFGGPIPVVLQHSSQGKTVETEGVRELADVIRDGNESKVNFYSQGIFGWRAEKRKNVIAECL